MTDCQIRTAQDVLDDLLTQREIKRSMLAAISRDLVLLERRIERLPAPLGRTPEAIVRPGRS